MNKPNIVLIVSDDHGREAAGCYGNTVIRTPNIDSLAADGVRFTNAFCTTASCAASRSVILTGLYNHTNGTYGHTHSAHHFSCFHWVETLPALMNEAGYRTACVGKKHYAPESLYPFQVDLGDSFGRDDVSMAEACRGIVSGGEHRTPFFLYWCSHDPHRSGEVSEDHPEKPNRFGNPPRAFGGDEESEYSDEEVLVPSFLSDNAATRAELSQYYQSISRLDRGIGRLVDIVKESGSYDDTLFVYVSDNGAAFPASKTTLYEPGMNLPCIVKAPGGRFAATVTDALVTWADLTPTILDFAGSDIDPERFHGRSFRRILGDPAPEDWAEEVYAAHTFHEITNYYPMRVVRTKTHKFIWNIAHPLTYTFASDLWRSATWQSVVRAPGGTLGRRSVEDYLHHDRFELYDLEADPDEIENLANRDEYADMVESFCRRIRAFQKRTDDPWLHKWEYE